MQVVILSARTGWHTDQLCRSLAERGHTAQVLPYEGLVARFGGVDATLKSEATRILEADAVLARIV